MREHSEREPVRAIIETESSMIEYERILLATDFSEAARIAGEHAKLLARKLKASLHILHVMENPLINLTLADSYTFPDEILKQAEVDARKHLELSLTPKQREDFNAVLAIRAGSPFVEIVRYGREQHMNLIILGTRGRGPIAHLLLGSVAEQVLRKANCPVLVVRKGDEELVMP